MGVGFFYLRLSVCLSVFPDDISKPIQLGSPNMIQKCSTMSPGNPFILESRSRESQILCPCGCLHSCECWLLLVCKNICMMQVSKLSRCNVECWWCSEQFRLVSMEVWEEVDSVVSDSWCICLHWRPRSSCWTMALKSVTSWRCFLLSASKLMILRSVNKHL